MMEHLFVYGTLRRGTQHPMHEVLARHARFGEAGWVRGRLYRIDGYPGYVPDPVGTDWVRGDVYAVPDAPTLLSLLDAYEEVNGADENAEYRRRRCWVRLDGGRWRTAWTYVYHRPVDSDAWIPSGDWLSTIRS